MTEIESVVSFFVITILSFFILEGILHVWILFVRKNFQWLITAKDEIPHLPEDGLSKFFQKGYDPELGWVRKPNTSGTENGKFGRTSWHINSKSCRTNPEFDDLESKISCYGDSFTFCRQVNDDETWQHYLSQKMEINVLNFGVGNYGLDQALLRMKREYPRNKTKIVVMGIVPDTVSRIMSNWKHYYEYGNTFAFKPKFSLENGKILLQKNLMNEESKFQKYTTYLDEIKKEDFFYEHKFKKEIIRFPYSYFFFRNLRRNLGILYWITVIKIKRKMDQDIGKIEWNPMRIIMRINLRWRVKLYENNEVLRLFEKLVEEFVMYGKSFSFKPIFLFLPQKDDLLFVKNNFNFYEKFRKKIENIDGLTVVDPTNDLISEINLDELYSDNNEYGGHYSKKGNEKIALILENNLKSEFKKFKN